MSQVEKVGDLAVSVGYLLKQTATALHASMDAVLRPQGLTVSQYSVLELLGHEPEQSNADLARGAFVTRQSMNEVLRGLQDRGLVARADVAEHGRARPTRLTPAGSEALAGASAAVARVEKRMLSPLSSAEHAALVARLIACRDALTGDGAHTGGDAAR
ncbi:MULTISPECIES: MarR family winged helix-turn-helix transcriptional regulator [unclassified Cryobacterium]|uniref:MarR family winged helix-turn-helix transcriptional regulator n=1 Tax=unclassified Cryobacterium TaxID=2649013 RepID=UPI002AB45F83|nr:MULTISPECIES: MarR family transcriptional regulator [unclassified Cryobacterium]MDY7541304.1 MarR family transcriptional regulator [Cryobacterium sp. 5B3]MEA9998104.1 MarR family transcriptional regulator [Cryobacterium sp. RTS3]MEB0266526.1 MarR family transcriptional regulator [Cryobacterium sp. 10I5]MEB0273397.1 MarR family transcriptional regulator [Cryobacterium sp. 5B3]